MIQVAPTLPSLNHTHKPSAYAKLVSNALLNFALSLKYLLSLTFTQLTISYAFAACLTFNAREMSNAIPLLSGQYKADGPLRNPEFFSESAPKFSTPMSLYNFDNLGSGQFGSTMTLPASQALGVLGGRIVFANKPNSKLRAFSQIVSITANRVELWVNAMGVSVLPFQSTFSSRILDVVIGRSKKKMIWIYAWWIVAVVTDKYLLWNWSLKNLIRDSMGTPPSIVMPKTTVGLAPCLSGPCPFPAFVHTVFTHPFQEFISQIVHHWKPNGSLQHRQRVNLRFVVGGGGG